jgi:molybdopterin-binding protein
MAGESYQVGPVRFTYGDGPPCVDMPGFQLEKGMVTVIAGDNGSGKTTLLKLMAGLLETGTTREEGSLEQLHGNAVYLHQVPYLFRGTVARNLRLAYEASGRGRTAGETKDAIETALGTVGLSGFADRRARSLSGGEGKRIALARVFLSTRPVLLLDEPAAHADDGSVRLIESACRRFAESGRTVVVATHRGSFGYRVADHLYELCEGRLVPTASNILKGEVLRQADGFLHFNSGEAEFRAPARDGTYQVAVIAGEDILISRHPLDSSARNCMAGTLTALDSRADGTIAAKVDCGMTLTSVITTSAAADLGLEAGARVFVTFKASSVRLY